jgi:hypothetical protein
MATAAAVSRLARENRWKQLGRVGNWGVCGIICPRRAAKTCLPRSGMQAMVARSLTSGCTLVLCRGGAQSRRVGASQIDLLTLIVLEVTHGNH